ncbi:hypothetical protein ANN_10550 [Periplaneta americana]|uniref:Uncharacterized protein n=1 Tax=Periplaneta americana TaxID=6978 RepID=A0ABQ8TS48_PERAM|nr:hypothetical protein ANN_10550 [Periplaneta americana]
MLGENPQTIRENAEILVEASRPIGLEVNPEKIKYMIMSRDQNIVRNGTIKIGDLSFEEVEKFKYLGATVTNLNDTREEIKRRINMGNACYYSVEKLLSSSLLSKSLKVRIYKTVILPVVLYGCETWTLSLREEQRLRVLENKVLRKIFGVKRDEVTEEWRKLHNAELHALYTSPDIIRNIKSRRLRWAGHVARMGESRNAYRVLVGRPEGKRPLGRPRRRWEDNIKMDLREVGYDVQFIFLEGTADYLAINHYTTWLVGSRPDEGNPSVFRDMGISIHGAKNWPKSNTSVWLSVRTLASTFSLNVQLQFEVFTLKVTPTGMRKLLNWIRQQYGDHWDIFITENGFADSGQLHDVERINYLAVYLVEILRAIHLDKSSVIGYTIWSLIDNFEWSYGYNDVCNGLLVSLTRFKPVFRQLTAQHIIRVKFLLKQLIFNFLSSKFGLYHVDFNDPQRTRTPKESSYFVRNLTRTRVIPDEFILADSVLQDQEKI